MYAAVGLVPCFNFYPNGSFMSVGIGQHIESGLEPSITDMDHAMFLSSAKSHAYVTLAWLKYGSTNSLQMTVWLSIKCNSVNSGGSISSALVYSVSMKIDFWSGHDWNGQEQCKWTTPKQWGDAESTVNHSQWGTSGQADSAKNPTIAVILAPQMVREAGWDDTLSCAISHREGLWSISTLEMMIS